MYVELHMLQNFAPSNLNRDDTNSPKDCEFGGYRRARISSQCLKRAIRTTFKEEELVPPQQLAARTKRLLDILVEQLAAQGRPMADAQAVVSTALQGIKLGPKDDGKTQYLLFLGEAEIARLAVLCEENWETLTQIGLAAGAEGTAESTKGRSKKEAKKAGAQAMPPALGKALEQVLDGGRAVDLALFGRMLADLPERNVDAACQVAHALSTNRVSMEFDFYTAVDDRKPQDTAGADMLGTVEFNSACFYRYANIDVTTLTSNLGGDTELAREAVRAFLHASVLAIPTGKQNSMAAQNLPSFLFAVVRERGLWSLANAFVKPVAPSESGDLVSNSIRALDTYWGKLATLYGTQALAGAWVASMEEQELRNLEGYAVSSVASLVEGAVEATFRGNAQQ
jgi:CRISPR system Cascade subunit CasC